MFIAALFFATGFLAFKFLSTGKISNTKRSGMYIGNQVWSGEIIITGDIEIIRNLTVLPGTVVKFVVGDDKKKGDEVEKDGFNDNDPTRTFLGLRVIAKGMARRIMKAVMVL